VWAPKLKTFGIWVAVPFVFAYVLVPLSVSMFRKESLQEALGFRDLILGLAYCAMPAMIGTVALWKLPIHRPLTGTLIGAGLSMILIALMGIIQMLLSPGMESGASVFVVSILLLAPTGAAGAWAGYLRGRFPN